MCSYIERVLLFMEWSSSPKVVRWLDRIPSRGASKLNFPPFADLFIWPIFLYLIFPSMKKVSPLVVLIKGYLPIVLRGLCCVSSSLRSFKLSIVLDLQVLC